MSKYRIEISPDHGLIQKANAHAPERLRIEQAGVIDFRVFGVDSGDFYFQAATHMAALRFIDRMYATWV